mmetsp:Transcript_78578/g.139427  ORF Transcript_78578/g.139427 Transcript_78578/m.139427 type:complete len:462 (+) Transcript_78578:32-1417(+)
MAYTTEMERSPVGCMNLCGFHTHFGEEFTDEDEGALMTPPLDDRAISTRHEANHSDNGALEALKRRNPNRYVSDIHPPETLWAIDDWHFLEKVRCFMEIEMRHIDPRNGGFTGRIIARWYLRTLNINDRTQPRIRVPGLRTQRLVVNVEESRIWREISKDKKNTIYWEGTSIITFSGFEIFEVHDFPYDRQVINLDLFEFVWREEKDSADYEASMQVVECTVVTTSMLPEWEALTALVQPMHPKKLGTKTPEFCSVFQIRLRMQRKEKYYITQIFLVTYLLLACALLPLGLAPGDAHIGDRLAVHAAGLLTLVAFKYGVQHDMPTVPYTTFTSNYLTYQIVTLVVVSMESLFSYKLVSLGQFDSSKIDDYEDASLVIFLIVWGVILIYCAFFRRREPWETVLQNQTSGIEVMEDDDFEEVVDNPAVWHKKFSPSRSQHSQNSEMRSRAGTSGDELRNRIPL